MIMSDRLEWHVDAVRADGLVRPLPVPQVGESTSYEFVFDPRGDSGELLVNEADYRERYTSVRDRLRHAGQFVVKRRMDGTPRWHEQTPRDADPLLVKLEPGDHQDVEEPTSGVWGLIEGGSTRPPVGRSPGFVTLDVLVVAELDDYASRRELEAELRFGN